MLTNYEEAMLIIWDIVSEKEHKHAESAGQVFDQSAFLTNHLSLEEMEII